MQSVGHLILYLRRHCLSYSFLDQEYCGFAYIKSLAADAVFKINVPIYLRAGIFTDKIAGLRHVLQCRVCVF
jgi:hypothetical protein